MRNMQAKLFMIPWFMGVMVMGQRDVLTAPDLLVNAHHRHFYEMLRRQQAINDALLLNNALHLHHLAPPPPTQTIVAPLAAPPPPTPQQLFHPTAFQLPNVHQQQLQSAKGTYEPLPSTTTTETTTTTQRKTLAGVKTVHIKRQDDNSTTTTTVLPPTVPPQNNEDEMSELFKKLNLSQQETKDIVEHVENLVRAELAKKLREAEILKSSTVVPTTTSSTTTTTTTLAPVQVPKLRIRNSDELEEVTIRKNTVKHHPMKKNQHQQQHTASSPIPTNGAIKTSLTHLPIFVATNEEDIDSVNAANNNKFTKKRILIASHDVDNENDKDVLVDFATGSPLELSEQEATELLPMAMNAAQDLAVLATTTTTTAATAAPPQIATLDTTTVIPRHPHHIPTNFERLASDYRQRLDGTGDISKILQKISKNAYISLGAARG